MKLCYNIFHIDGLGESSSLRKDLSNRVIARLLGNIDRLNTKAVLINNQESYEKFKKEVFDLKPHFEFKFGEMGVWASNVLALLNFIESDYDAIMLMEDDIDIAPNFYPLLMEYISSLPDDWDVFSYFVHKNQFGRYNEISNNSKIVKAYQDWSMLCWIITKDCAKKIIEDISINGINMPIDWYIFRQPDKFNSYTLSPVAERGCELYETSSTFQQIDERISL